MSPGRAVQLLIELSKILGGGTTTPTAVLQAARRHDRITVGPLARALEAYFVDAHLALPLDHAEQTARTKRARRVAEVPEAFQVLAARFDLAQLENRERAWRAGTKPRSDRTLEINLSAVRDLALFLANERPGLGGWETVSAGDVEAFLTLKTSSNRARQLHCLRGFFRWARARRAIATDPTRGLMANSNIPFRGVVLDAGRDHRTLPRLDH